MLGGGGGGGGGKTGTPGSERERRVRDMCMLWLFVA